MYYAKANLLIIVEMSMSQRRYYAPVLQICIQYNLKTLAKQISLSMLKCTESNVRQCENQKIVQG